MVVYTLSAVLVLVIVLAFIIIRNLLMQNNQLERVILNAREQSEEALLRIRAIDNKEAFEKDDEVGVVFKQIVTLITQLNDFIHDRG